ncbi:hypothetical protein K3001_29065, partial [Pseudomonas aeruginosa]|nr:hypothetical protein [Pseudomonas aeruginosa]
MSEISRVALFGKLNSLAYKAIEAATVFCKLRGNPYVELVHWFHQILQLPDSDLHQIVRQSGIDPARLAKDLTEALDRLPRGSTSITDLSSHVEEAVERGWVYGSLMFGESQVRTGYLVIGILKTPSLRHALTGLSAEFAKLKVEALTERFDEYVGASSRICTWWCFSMVDATPRIIRMALCSDGSSTCTTWKRRVSAGSFSMCFLYSAQVVAAT